MDAKEWADYNKKTYKREVVNGELSIIMPSHNRAHLIDFNLPSIYNQPFGHEYEIIVIDDRSTDNCREVVEKHNKICGGKIRYIRLDKDIIAKPRWDIVPPNTPIPEYPGTFRNGDRAINVGVRHAKYGLVMQSDPEVFHLCNNMQRFVNWAESINFDWFWSGSTGAVRVFGDGQREREGLRVATEEFFKKNIKYQFDKNGYIEGYEEIKSWLRVKNFEIGGCVFPICVCFSREPFALIRGFDEDTIGYGWGDNDIIGRLQRIGVNVSGTLWNEPQWIHLYHECRTIPHGGYNQIMCTAKENMFPEDKRYSVEANQRNSENWGSVQ